MVGPLDVDEGSSWADPSSFLAQFRDAWYLCSLPKTSLMSGIPACLKFPTCLFLQRSSKVARSAATVLTKSMSKMCVTREA
jgi:hypothetical protein